MKIAKGDKLVSGERGQDNQVLARLEWTKPDWTLPASAHSSSGLGPDRFAAKTLENGAR
jgi:hypothetical protein